MYFDSENHRNVTKRKNLSVWNARSFVSFVRCLRDAYRFSTTPNHLYIGQSVRVFMCMHRASFVWCTHILKIDRFSPCKQNACFCVGRSFLLNWKISNAKMVGTEEEKPNVNARTTTICLTQITSVFFYTVIWLLIQFRTRCSNQIDCTVI